MPSRNSLAAAIGVAACAAALGLAPAASAAGTISLSQPCYIAPPLGEGTDVTVSGSGFTPGEAVFAQIPAPGGLAGFTEVTIGPDGTFTATVEHVFPETIDPVAEKKVMQIKGVLSDQILTEAPFELSNLAVQTKPSTARPGKKVLYMFSGFAPGKPIWGHYFFKGHPTLTYKFGKAGGACGLLHTKAKIYPGGDRHSKYKVQFDDRKKFSKQATPRFDTTLAITSF